MSHIKYAWRGYRCACGHVDGDHYTAWYILSSNKDSAYSECKCEGYDEQEQF